MSSILDVLFLVQIGHKAGDLALGRAQGGQEVVDLLLAGGGEGDLRALAQESLDDGGADAAGAAGDQNYLVLQFEIHVCSSYAMRC